MNQLTSILALGAHPDDLELGCGGTLAKLASQGRRIRAVIFTEGHRGDTDGYDRAVETREALAALGVEEVCQHQFVDTRLHESLNDLIATIECHMREISPDRVYTMFDQDRHQDHRAVYHASMVACRPAPQILGYETPSSYPNFVPTHFERIEDFIEQKVSALRAHESQSSRHYMQEVKIRSAAHFRGVQVDLDQVEGFIPYKMIF